MDPKAEEVLIEQVSALKFIADEGLLEGIFGKSVLDQLIVGTPKNPFRRCLSQWIENEITGAKPFKQESIQLLDQCLL